MPPSTLRHAEGCSSERSWHSAQCCMRPRTARREHQARGRVARQGWETLAEEEVSANGNGATRESTLGSRPARGHGLTVICGPPHSRVVSRRGSNAPVRAERAETWSSVGSFICRSQTPEKYSLVGSCKASRLRQLRTQAGLFVVFESRSVKRCPVARTVTWTVAVFAARFALEFMR
jgi:hypothetical protein